MGHNERIAVVANCNCLMYWCLITFLYRCVFEGCVDSTTLSSPGPKPAVHRNCAARSQWIIHQEESSLQQEDKLGHLDVSHPQTRHELLEVNRMNILTEWLCLCESVYCTVLLVISFYMNVLVCMDKVCQYVTGNTFLFMGKF